MIWVEDDLEGAENNKRGGSQKPRKGKVKMSDPDVVGSLRDMLMAAELRGCVTAMVEDMEVGDPERVSMAGHTNGESWDIGAV